MGRGQSPNTPKVNKDQVSEEVRTLAQEVCSKEEFSKALGPLHEKEKAYYESEQEANAVELFLHWGSGWFENETFLLHGYTYDDTCQCGAWQEDLPRRFHGVDQEKERKLRRLMCCCEEGEAEEAGGERISLSANFVHKPTGFTVTWYKHSRRGVKVSPAMPALKIREVFTECLTSLQEEDYVACTSQKEWPVNLERRLAFERQRERVSQMSDEEINEISLIDWSA